MLTAQVKTQLQRYTRCNRPQGPPRETYKCRLYGEELALTPLEFSILWHLCGRRGHVVSSE